MYCVLQAESESQLEDESRVSTVGEPVAWTRLPGQICKVPNKLNKSLKAGRNGCSVLRFSNDGRWVDLYSVRDIVTPTCSVGLKSC